MLVPAIVACFLYSPYDELTFIASLNYKAYIPISATFNVMFGESWKFVWPVIVIGVFQVVASSLIMSAIDRHFRTGKLSLRSPARLLNYSIFPLAVCVAIMCVTAIILRFVLFGLVTLVQVSFRAMGASESAAFAVICVLAVAVFVVHILIITPMLFWQPAMFIYGYKFRDAAASSIKLMSGKKLYRGVLFPLLIVAAIQLIFAFLDLHQSVTYIVGFVTFLVTNVYVVVYVIVSFYAISDLDRRDLMPYLIPLPVIPTKPDDAEAKGEKQKAKKQSAQKSDGGGVGADTDDAESVPERKERKKSDAKKTVKTRKSTATKPVANKKDGATARKTAADKSSAKKPTDKKKQAKKPNGKKANGAGKTENVGAPDALTDAVSEKNGKEEGGDVV